MTRLRNVQGTIVETTLGNDISYAQENIEFNAVKQISFTGEDKGVSFGKPESFKSTSENFDISLSINKKQSTFVPFGILDFENNYENRFFVFDYSLKWTNLDSLNFQIFSENGEQIYQMNHYAPIVVTAQRTPKLFDKLKEETPPLDPLKPIKTFDIQKLIDDYLYPDFTDIGNYCIFWDGFNNDEIYDSTWFDGKKLKAKITAIKGGTTKVQEVDFETTRKEVDWVDVKINKATKRIDVTLRVDLKDGGAKGLDCKQVLKGIRDNTHWVTECPWDDIPLNVIQPNKPIIKQRTRSFADLEKLALDGLNYHWGRNKTHAVAKDVKIYGQSFEVYINAINTNEKAMDDLDLVYNTNAEWMRSGNPGSATTNPISWVGNLISREAVCYNVGYIKYSNGWGYANSSKEDLEFKDTSAHEVGHEILKSYGGTFYSYGHKGSVNTVTQNRKNSAPEFPLSGEIDLMPYFKDNVLGGEHNQPNYFNRRVAAEKDVLSLIWLTKIKIS